MTEPRINASLFKNDRKEADKQPDFTGPGTVTPDDLKAFYEAAIAEGAQFDDRGNIKVRIAGWRKVSAGGTNYISLSLTLDRPKPAAAGAPAAKPAAIDEDDLF